MLALVKCAEGRGNLELREVPEPAVGEADVLIEVKAAGICGSDIGFADEERMAILHPPVVLGHEFAGVVAAVGRKVTAWKVGDPVVSDNTGRVCGTCYACSVGDYLLCPDRLGLGYGMDGGFTRYVRIEGDLLARVPNTLFRIPSGVPFEHAALLDPAANAYRAVVQEGRLLPGEVVAVFGVGALGQFSIQMARIAGASEIVAIGLSADSGRFRDRPCAGRHPLPLRRPRGRDRRRPRPDRRGGTGPRHRRGGPAPGGRAGDRDPAQHRDDREDRLRSETAWVLLQSPPRQGPPAEGPLRLRLGLLEELPAAAGQGHIADRPAHHPHAPARAGGARASSSRARRARSRWS